MRIGLERVGTFRRRYLVKTSFSTSLTLPAAFCALPTALSFLPSATSLASPRVLPKASLMAFAGLSGGDGETILVYFDGYCFPMILRDPYDGEPPTMLGRRLAIHRDRDVASTRAEPTGSEYTHAGRPGATSRGPISRRVWRRKAARPALLCPCGITSGARRCQGTRAGSCSSVTTLKRTRLATPKAVEIGTSAASRPRPMTMRPMRG